ncbi:flagellar basal body rod protein FlgB [Curvibacter lanceolatus]|uniref:flagellar basal body rod protein FlgB n=1 Tax=Curvibacter lanceolatus TaxID=86182 RepID=UPI00037563B0|nr:flagellar basal body rod protein FlgB [Curvibacter lanceolatus]
MSDPAKFLPLNGSGGAGASLDEEWRGRALILRAQRQALLASNIANADTPGYKAKDINFSEAMQDAMGKLPALTLQMTSVRHVSTADSQSFAPSTLDFARYVVPSQPSMDNNSVDMDRERAAFTMNSILHRMAIDTFDDEYKEFKQAASDPRR